MSVMRALVPYLIASLAVTVLTAVAYGAEWIGVGGFYAGILLAGVVLLPGVERWDTARHRGISER